MNREDKAKEIIDSVVPHDIKISHIHFEWLLNLQQLIAESLPEPMSKYDEVFFKLQETINALNTQKEKLSKMFRPKSSRGKCGEGEE